MTVLAQEDAPTAFCRREHQRLLASMTLYTGDGDLAAELAQEALARAYRDWARVAEMAEPGAWTHRVAVNLANSHFRRRRYERAARLRAEARTPTSATLPENGFDAVLRRALLDLPPRQREAVVLRYLLDLSVDTAAGRMGCAAGTVRALTAQALSRLRTDPVLAHLQEDGDD